MSLSVRDTGCGAQSEPADATLFSTADVAARIGRPDCQIVDVRDSNAFNGWILGREQRGGHIRGAMNLALRWIDEHPQAALRLVESNGLEKKQVVIYGNSVDEARRMARWLRTEKQLSSNQLFIYADGVEAWSRRASLPMDRLPRYEKLVPPRWLQQLTAAQASRPHRIVEVAWRKRKRYEAGHLPGAVYLDTDEFESLPLWNIVPRERIASMLLSLGITKDTLVVVYGRDATAAARAAVVMMHAGVADVRLLNGGYQAWLDAGLPVDHGHVPRRLLAPTSQLDLSGSSILPRRSKCWQPDKDDW